MLHFAIVYTLAWVVMCGIFAVVLYIQASKHPPRCACGRRLREQCANDIEDGCSRSTAAPFDPAPHHHVKEFLNETVRNR